MIPFTINAITRRNGIAGQYSYDVTVTYHMPDFESGRTRDDVHRVSFIGSAYGAPVVMVTDSGMQTPVVDWTRYGDTLNPAWVRRFYGVAS